jgi:hypothetical protein
MQRRIEAGFPSHSAVANHFPTVAAMNAALLELAAALPTNGRTVNGSLSASLT